MPIWVHYKIKSTLFFQWNFNRNKLFWLDPRFTGKENLFWIVFTKNSVRSPQHNLNKHIQRWSWKDKIIMITHNYQNVIMIKTVVDTIRMKIRTIQYVSLDSWHPMKVKNECQHWCFTEYGKIFLRIIITWLYIFQLFTTKKVETWCIQKNNNDEDELILILL